MPSISSAHQQSSSTHEVRFDSAATSHHHVQSEQDAAHPEQGRSQHEGHQVQHDPPQFPDHAVTGPPPLLREESQQPPPLLPASPLQQELRAPEPPPYHQPKRRASDGAPLLVTQRGCAGGQLDDHALHETPDEIPFQTVFPKQRAKQPSAPAGPQLPPARDSLERGEVEKPQEHRFPVADFVPDWATHNERTMWMKDVTQIFRNNSKSIPRCKIMTAEGHVVIKCHMRKADAKAALCRLADFRVTPLPERQCYWLMNHQNLVEFTERTGAYAICRPKEDQVIVLGPSDAVARGQQHLCAQQGSDGNRRMMRVSVVARNFLLERRKSLVKGGHIWLSRESEKDGTQELHIVGHDRNFEFAAAEKAIRAAEQQCLQKLGGSQSPGRGEPAVLRSTDGGPGLQVRRHKDSSKLLIAEPLGQVSGPLPMATACPPALHSSGTSETQTPQPPSTAHVSAPASTMHATLAPVPAPRPGRAVRVSATHVHAHTHTHTHAPPGHAHPPGAATRTGRPAPQQQRPLHHNRDAQSTDDFPHLVNPLKAGSQTQWSRIRGDPTNSWATFTLDLGSLSSAVASTGSLCTPYRAYTSSTGTNPVHEDPEELEAQEHAPAESFIGEDVDGMSAPTSAALDSPSGTGSRLLSPDRLLHQLLSAIKSCPGPPQFTHEEKEMLCEICSAAGVLPGADSRAAGPPALMSPCDTPRSSPAREPPVMQKLLVLQFRGESPALEGRRIVEIVSGAPFSENRKLIFSVLEIAQEDEDHFVFERVDHDFDTVVIVTGAEVLPDKTRLGMRPADTKPLPPDFEML